MKKILLIIVGPTASGKSALAVRLARRLSGEIISADSRQVYTSLDIGTGKITRREQRGVRHHLLDIADPKVPVNSPRHFSVEKWREAAERAIADIRARGRLPIITGGTGFYISALVDGLTFPDVPPDKRLRERLAKIFAKKGTAELFSLLKKLDPRRAREMEKNGDMKNVRRLIRAVEIATALGKVPKVMTRRTDGHQRYDPIFIGIDIAPEILKKRIEKRLKIRLKKGMIAEIKNLHRNQGLSWKRLDELGLEYRFISEYLRGPHTLAHKEKMTISLATAIRHYAKRQMTWWKKDKRIVWLTPDKIESRANYLIKNY